ncbi:uncharacterized protein LOC107608995 isoform X1 [Arachis ipaensis]|uniref:uncharacterized protein LOC107608995 isoform X1 n=1 Tax=Arachis ipaensis TaxID=130454 RepID=UPI0007AF2CA0|nr:uncharacterized protein LOC107608995 isoform X1 [Arachis ipaensis]
MVASPSLFSSSILLTQEQWSFFAGALTLAPNNTRWSTSLTTPLSVLPPPMLPALALLPCPSLWASIFNNFNLFLQLSDHHYGVNNERYISTLATKGMGHLFRKGTGGKSSVRFHTYDYARHFVSACTRILGLEGTSEGVEDQGKLTRVAAVKILMFSIFSIHLTA